jgi:hypothetical protein
MPSVLARLHQAREQVRLVVSTSMRREAIAAQRGLGRNSVSTINRRLAYPVGYVRGRPGLFPAGAGRYLGGDFRVRR